MSEKATLKEVNCPACGGVLKVENTTDAIVCVYCDNTIIPGNTSSHQEIHKEVGGLVRVEGIKTPSSALAYVELFFEEYDWDAFSYAQMLSIPEIDKLADSLKTTSADDKKTWFVCFNAIAVPFFKKINGCKQMLDLIVDEYKNGDLDAYSKFDAYKRISAMISSSKATIVAKLEKIIANAAKYGATEQEVAKLKHDLDSYIVSSSPTVYNDIEEIGEIKSFVAKRNAEIVSELAANGINAEQEYNKAKELIAENVFVSALNILRGLRGYKDSDALIDKINKYYLISDVLEVEGKLYYYVQNEDDTLELHPSADGKVIKNPIITNITKVITNYADVLYFLTDGGILKSFSLSGKSEKRVYKKPLNRKHIHAYGTKVYLLEPREDVGGGPNNIIELDVATGTVKPFLEGIVKTVSMSGSKLIYTHHPRIKRKEYSEEIVTSIIDVDTMATVELGTKTLSVEGYIDNYVVYTQMSPNKYNNNLYVKSFDSSEPEKLIEQNIYKFCRILAGKLFYYVGNAKNKSLININPDATERKELPLYISKLLFEQGGWIYFIRKSGYNTVLCKARLDGTQLQIIASDIENFIEIKNGYLYYVNSDATLIKVRMDGSNAQKLCEDVEEVLAVKENKIVFVSVDGVINDTNGIAETKKTVKSIYSLDFSGTGKYKLAYDIKLAKKHDENTVYYIASEEIKSSYSNSENYDVDLEILYNLHVETNISEKLLELRIKKKKGLSAFAIAMIVTAIFVLLAIIGFAAEAPGLGIFGIMTALISFVIGMFKRESTE